MRAEKPDRKPEGPDDELLAALRVALRPGPLPSALSHGILSTLKRRGAPARCFGLPAARVIWLAAAACVMVAVLFPPHPVPQASDVAAPYFVTSDEAAEIVAAYAILSWDSPIDYTFDAVDASLGNIDRTLRREPGSISLLPWSRDDEWDVPLATDGSTSRSWAPPGTLCPAV
ncbi:MAG: hypothetical protein ACE5I3_13850 [Phycisphaerae bacterium]